jgi:hypothetical protein
MRSSTLLIAAAWALAVAAPARAAGPLDLGVGSNPAGLIDGAGTAHIVFTSPGGQTYCRLPYKATACDILTALPLDGAWGDVKIFRRPADGALLVVQGSTADVTGAEHGTTWLRSSVDGGATWQGPSAIATGITRLDDSVLAADGQSVFTVASLTEGLFFQSGPFGSSEPRRINVDQKPDGSAFSPTDGGAVTQAKNGRVVVAVDGIDDTRWRSFAVGDLYDQNAWQPFPARTIRGEGSPVLATGKRGTFLLNQRQVPVQRGPHAPFAIRSYDSRRNRWRAPKAAAEDRLVFGTSTLVADGMGRLHLGWASNSGGHGACFVYARTGTRSTSWFGRSTTLFRTTVAGHDPVGPALAVGADGRGVALWGEEGTETSPPNGHVFATPLKQRQGRYRPIRDSYDRPYC